jgi:hypothetical protein
MPTVQWRITDPKRFPEHEYWDVANPASDLAEALVALSAIGENQLQRQGRPFRAGSR